MPTCHASVPNGFFAGVPLINPHYSLFLLQMVIILGVCRATALIGLYFKQPRVVFEKIGGILVGPSLFGLCSQFEQSLFPPSSVTNIQFIAGIAINIYMLIIGLGVKSDIFLSNRKTTFCVALCSIAVPFALGWAVSPMLFSQLQHTHPIDPRSFNLFIATSMSVTAFPMLSRVLRESGLAPTKIGQVVMGAASLNDAFAWTFLIITVSTATSNAAKSAWSLCTIAAYAVFLCVVVRPLLRVLVARI